MKPEKRQKKILAILRAMQKEIRVEELVEMLGVSSLTIRRDLKQLARDKTIIRTHGGCLSVGRAALETEYHNKVALNFELKQAIGRRTAESVKSGEVLLVNDGSTTFHLAAHLGYRAPLTIYTNSLAMISELGRYPGIRLYILGGEYYHESYSLKGGLTEQILDSLHFDWVFLGADAIDEAGKCMVGTPEEARMTRLMLKSGDKKVLLADHTKVGKRGYTAYGKLDDFDEWITTGGIDADSLLRYQKMTRIIRVFLNENQA
ncbi:MAG: DeoR/GlpR family DNA-binding transcription regulator [Spirochaetota bacterium]